MRSGCSSTGAGLLRQWHVQAAPARELRGQHEEQQQDEDHVDQRRQADAAARARRDQAEAAWAFTACGAPKATTSALRRSASSVNNCATLSCMRAAQPSSDTVEPVVKDRGGDRDGKTHRGGQQRDPDAAGQQRRIDLAAGGLQFLERGDHPEHRPDRPRAALPRWPSLSSGRRNRRSSRSCAWASRTRQLVLQSLFAQLALSEKQQGLVQEGVQLVSAHIPGPRWPLSAPARAVLTERQRHRAARRGRRTTPRVRTATTCR